MEEGVFQRKRCADVTFSDIEASSGNRDDFVALLGHMASIARPFQGAPTILFALAHLAACRWLRGGLRTTLKMDGDATVIEVTEELGPSVRAPFWSGRVGAPFSEFREALPHLRTKLFPLRLLREKEGALMLGVSERGRAVAAPMLSEPPPPTVRGGPVIPPPPAVPSDQMNITTQTMDAISPDGGDIDEIDTKW
jgi:hypothetical protein